MTSLSWLLSRPFFRPLSRSLPYLSSWLTTALTCFVTFSATFSTQAHADPNRALAYRGSLSNAQGQVLDGPHTLTFRIFDQLEEGALLWMEELPEVSIIQGRFSVYLGLENPLDHTLFSGGEAYLEITVGEETLHPRTRFASAPHAFAAQHAMMSEEALNSDHCVEAESLRGLAPEAFASHDHQHDDLYQRPLQQACAEGEALRGFSEVGVPLCAELPSSSDAHSLTAQGGDRDVVFVSAEGHVGVGTTTPSVALDVSGGLRVSSLSGSGDRMVITNPAGQLSSAAIPSIPDLTNLPGTYKVLTQENIYSTRLQNDDLVRIEGDIELTQDVDFRGHRLIFFGGHITGSTGEEKLDIGIDSIMIGTELENLKLDGLDVQFIKVLFRGQISFPSNSKIVDSTLNSVNALASARIETILSSTVLVSQLSQVKMIHGSYFRDSTLSVEHADHSRFSSCTLTLKSDSRIDNNEFTRSKLIVPATAYGFIQITGNLFDDLLDGASEFIFIDGSSSGYSSYLISNNTFSPQSRDPYSISIQGQSTNSYHLIKLSGNSFNRGEQVLNYSSSFKLLVSDNLLYDTALGVSSSSNVRLRNNETFVR